MSRQRRQFRRALARLAFGFVAGMALSLLAFSVAHAEIRPSLVSSTRTEGMGGAYIGLADDENALFLNPAGLAGVKNVTFNYLNAQGEMSGDTLSAYKNAKDAFKKFDSSSINSVLGYDIYGRGTVTSIFQMPGFSLGVISDTQLFLDAENRALPQIKLGDQTTNGIQAGFGFSTKSDHRVRPGEGELRFGFAVKAMYRRGGYYLLQPTDLLQLDNGGKALLENTVGQYGLGFGGDVGTQWIQEVKKGWSLSAGISYRDIGNTSFDSTQAAPIQSNLGIGFASKWKMGLAHLNVAYDYTNILQTTDWRLRNHFGAELQLPLLSFYAGINQVYPSFGVGVDIWLFKLQASTFGQEMGAIAYQNPMRVYSLELSMKLEF